MRRLKTTEIPAFRSAAIDRQGGRCAVCQLPISKPCADHDHATGAMRGVLHNGCNAVLGKIENSYRRYGIINLAAFLGGVAGYLQKHSVNTTGLLHPTFKTDDEKRIKRNAAARARTASKRPAT